MDFSKRILALLAIFCVIASATAVCAADVGVDGGNVEGQYADDDGYAGVNYEDANGFSGSQYQDDGGWAGSQYNESAEDISGRPIIDPDYAHHEPAAGEPVNATGNATGNMTGNVTNHSAGEPVNATGNTTAHHTMPATGNPIIALFAVAAVLGGYTVLRRK